MPTTPLLKKGDSEAEAYASALATVMRELQSSLVDVVSGAQTARNVFDSAVILNSGPAMLQALADSGYDAIADDLVAEYPAMIETVRGMFDANDLPRPEFTTADRETFRQLATADLEEFDIIGKAALDELRLGLHRQAISGQPFSALVESIAAATVGVDGKGSPLANRAKTYANTAILNFGGESLRVAGEAIGAELWEVVGPSDNVTRQECRSALNNPIRSEEEWKKHKGSDGSPYWGGTPGGWNCRHQLFPVVDV